MPFLLVGLAATWVGVTGGAPRAGAAPSYLPPGFSDTTLIAGLEQPTAFRIAPDGRVWVAEKSGIVKVFPSLGNPNGVVALDRRVLTYNLQDRGMLGLAIDPQFPARPYAYVAYSYDKDPNSPQVPRWGSSDPGASTFDSCPSPPGLNTDGCTTLARVSRFTISGSALTSETVLITDYCMQFASHSVGALQIGPDGMLYVAGGDGADYNVADYGQLGGSPGSPTPRNPCNDPPGGVGGAMNPPSARGGTLRSQSPRRPGGEPRVLDGTIIRVNPDTGAGVAGNPFFSSGDANARRIVAYGLKNPYRWTFRPGTSEIWAGDVGLAGWEEIDRIADAGGAAENFGHPCYEGAAPQPDYQALGLSICTSLYGEGSALGPYFQYSHYGPVTGDDAGECPAGGGGGYIGSSISGLAFNSFGSYPAPYQGALFFADYSRTCIWAMLPGGGGLPDPGNVVPFVRGAGYPVDLQIDPATGDLLYLDIGFGSPTGGAIHRISYAGAGAPSVTISTNPGALAGGVPFTVGFNANPAGGTPPYTYLWTFGDGGTSTAKNPTHTYTQIGTYTATVRVTSSGGGVGQASVVVRVGVPTAAIIAPSPATTWKVGAPISYAGLAASATGQLLPASAVSWRFYLRHCTTASDCHSHDLGGADGVLAGTITAPDHEYPSYLQVEMKATDGGVSATQMVELSPQTTTLTVDSAPRGLTVSTGIGGESGPAPIVRPAIVGSRNTVTATAHEFINGTTYSFLQWSDGGGLSHEVIANGPTTVVAYSGWKREDLETGGGADPAAVLYNGQPHVFFVEGGQLFHRWYDGQWRVDNPAGASAQGGISAYVFGNGVQVVYRDGNGNLAQTWWDGIAWRSRVLDDGQIGSTTAVVYGTGPHVFYERDGRLWHTWWNGAQWGRDNPAGATGGLNPAAILYQGKPHVFYTHAGQLWQVWWDGARWSRYAPPGALGGNEPSVVLYQGQPHVFFEKSGQLWHTWWNGLRWSLDSPAGALGATGSSAVLYDGRPHVFYRTEYDRLGMAFWAGTGWAKQEIDGPGLGLPGRPGDPFVSTAALLYAGQVHVFAATVGGAERLAHAWFR